MEDGEASGALEPRGGYQALRRGRVSVPGNNYFLTFVTGGRRLGLNDNRVFSELLSVLRGLPCSTLAIVVMPDHLHWLLRLDHETSLSEVVRLSKGRMSPILRSVGLSWQRGAYHDRRVRPDEPLSAFLRYMLSNPYRAEVCRLSERYAFWYCDPEVEQWFLPTTNGGLPYGEWLRQHRFPPWERTPDERGVEG